MIVLHHRAAWLMIVLLWLHARAAWLMIVLHGVAACPSPVSGCPPPRSCSAISSTVIHFCGQRAEPNLQLTSYAGWTPHATSGLYTWVRLGGACVGRPIDRVMTATTLWVPSSL
jgi:hypothetical protein